MFSIYDLQERINILGKLLVRKLSGKKRYVNCKNFTHRHTHNNSITEYILKSAGLANPHVQCDESGYCVE